MLPSPLPILIKTKRISLNWDTNTFLTDEYPVIEIRGLSSRTCSKGCFVPCVFLVHCLTLFLNMWACLAAFITDSGNGVDFGLSILWFILFSPVAFICWYRPVYKAFRYVFSHFSHTKLLLIDIVVSLAHLGCVFQVVGSCLQINVNHVLFFILSCNFQFCVWVSRE